jgi:hypothetical protein
MVNGEKEKNFWTYYKEDNEKVKERLLQGNYDKASMTGWAILMDYSVF